MRLNADGSLPDLSLPGRTQRERAQLVTNNLRHYVYRCYDAYGVLLYIGCTANVKRRMGSHRRGDGTKNASRWLSVCMDRYEVSGPYPNRASGRKAETAAIDAERPVFNIQQACRRASSGPIWRQIADYLIARGHVDLAIETACRCASPVREAGCYDPWCIPHSTKPGDLPPFDWDAYYDAMEAEESA